jgi:hypothetical protein
MLAPPLPCWPSGGRRPTAISSPASINWRPVNAKLRAEVASLRAKVDQLVPERLEIAERPH